jgi:hypothetical protein
MVDSVLEVQNIKLPDSGGTTGADVFTSTGNVPTIASGVTFPAGHVKFLGRVAGNGNVETYSTSLTFCQAVELPIISTTNLILLDVEVYAFQEYSCINSSRVFCLYSGASAPSAYSSGDQISASNFTTLLNTQNSYFFQTAFDPDSTNHYNHNLKSTFLFNGTDELLTSENSYFYVAHHNGTGSGAFTKIRSSVNSVTVYEIQV